MMVESGGAVINLCQICSHGNSGVTVARASCGARSEAPASR